MLFVLMNMKLCLRSVRIQAMFLKLNQQKWNENWKRFPALNLWCAPAANNIKKVERRSKISLFALTMNLNKTKYLHSHIILRLHWKNVCLLNFLFLRRASRYF